MNKKIAEWYVKNKGKINMVLIVILIILIVNVILVFLSNRTKQKQSENIIINNNSEKKETEYLQGYNSILPGSESLISGEDITSGNETQLESINKFFEFCKSKNLEEAYEMLSNDCKDLMYPSIEEFKKGYYDAVFDNQDKMITVENWIGNIYKVKISDNALSTGIYNGNSGKQDYISVVVNENKDGYLLNINGYIAREQINKTVRKDKFDITVKYTDIYKDYQTYTFSVTNKSDKTILLDNKLDINSMYIEDANNIQYPAYTHEISEAELVVTPGTTKDVTIKYYNKFISTKEIRKIGFSNIQLNYQENARKEYQDIIIEL